MNRNSLFILFILCMITSCSKDDDVQKVNEPQWETYKVAIVLPMDDGLEAHWKRTLDQCANDLKEAFTGQLQGIALEYEWFDEDTGDMEQLAETLSERKDISAVIGGFHSDNAKILASKLCRSKIKKTFFTLATTEELVRGYSSSGWLWAMSETDITQCEVLLSKAYAYGAKSVGLIADGASMYGKTFVEWFGFQAKEMGLEVKGIFDYSNSTIGQKAWEAAESKADYIICAPNDISGVYEIQETMYKHALSEGTSPRCLYSDIAYGANVIQILGKYAEGLEGVSIGADPESGFDIRYEMKHGVLPTNGEAQVYDAAIILGYAFYVQLLNEGMPLNEAIQRLVDGRDEGMSSWTITGMKNVVSSLSCGGRPDLRGVSGALDFDNKVYTTVLSSTYYNYMVYNGRYVILDYNSGNGSARTDATLASWNYQSSQMQEFSDMDSDDMEYPPLNDKWAVLVASSYGWNNYRHQADVYNMYQLLRKSGYDDEHIILIAEDDIANHLSNPYPGVVCTTNGGENVYAGVTVDYHPSDLNPDDLKSILCGEQNDKLSQVLATDENDNVFLFWSGHGILKEMMWLDHKDGFNYDYFKEVFTSMRNKKCYRKMLCLIEACYSGSVFNASEGVQGILAFTASDANETSKADVYNCDLEVWMTNRFTSSFMEAVGNNPSLSLYGLYNFMFRNTLGSHVMVYNNQNYGNLHKNTLSEFIYVGNE